MPCPSSHCLSALEPAPDPDLRGCKPQASCVPRCCWFPMGSQQGAQCRRSTPGLLPLGTDCRRMCPQRMKQDPASARARPTAPAGAGDRICFFPTSTGIPVSRLSPRLPWTEFGIQEGFSQALIYLECLGHRVAPRTDWNNASNKRGNDH